ncbi:SMP-30/gluconolactonase/LRE family protein [Actinocrispum wychmicini]|nr:SMP-30/gluconolactonase/LRE family protein [Actinocrispum wychmicini]
MTSETPLPPPRVMPIPGHGPEDVALDADGTVITGVDDGRILRLSPDGRDIRTIADTGGRPLGIEVFPDGRILVCDAERGLLVIDADRVHTLVDQVDGEPVKLCNNAAVAADGTVYFTDSSRRFSLQHWMGDLLEHSGTGRLLCRHPDGAVEVLRTGLQFANGVALAPDESFVAYAETGAYRLTRRWLTGPKAGTDEVLMDNLPGFPDNISLGSDGLIWIALASSRNPTLDALLGRPPVLRKVVWALPKALQPKPRRLIWVLAVDADGRVVHDFQGPGTEFYETTGVRERAGTVYLGSLVGRTVAAFDLPL